MALAVPMNFVRNTHKCLHDQGLTFPCMNTYSFTEFTIGVKWVVFATWQEYYLCWF